MILALKMREIKKNLLFIKVAVFSFNVKNAKGHVGHVKHARHVK